MRSDLAGTRRLPPAAWYRSPVFDRLRKDVRDDPRGVAWFAAHAVALLILTLVTLARGTLFLVLGAAIAVSALAGQLVLRRRAGSRDRSRE